MTVFVPESIKVLGSDAGGASVVLCDMFVDDLADLPAPTAYNGYKLAMGCTATVINDNSKHRINSAGQWVQIAAGTSTYTRAEIDTILRNIDAGIAAVVNAGAKNRLNYNLATFGGKSKVTISQDGSITGSITSDTRQYIWDNREFEFTLPAGDYVIRINRLAGNSAYTSARLMTAENANLCTVATNPNIAPSMRSFTLDSDTTLGFMGKVFSDTIQLMLCTAKDYAISPAFVPYAPTNRELYELIKSYHP